MKTTLKTAKFCAKTAKWWCKNGEMVVLWRRFLCVFQAVAMCSAEKMLCGDGGWVVYFRRVHAWFPAFWLPKWRNGGAIAAVLGQVAAKT